MAGWDDQLDSSNSLYTCTVLWWAWMISLMSQIPYVHLLFYGGLGSFMSQIPSVSVLFYGGLGFMSQMSSVYVLFYGGLGFMSQMSSVYVLFSGGLGFMSQISSVCMYIYIYICTVLWWAWMISFKIQDSRLLYYLIREIKMWLNFNVDVSNSFCLHTCTDGMISLTHQIISVHVAFAVWR